MAPLALISVGGLSLLLGQVMGDTISSPLSCLEQMNKVREAAGLPKFVENTQLLPSEAPKTPDDFWEKLCAKVRGDPATEAVGSAPQGTYAFYPTSEDAGNCTAAVEFWEGGFSLFNDKLPEKYIASSPNTYSNQRAVSFVALFNPKPDASVHCTFAKCPKTAPEPDLGGRRRLAAETLNSVICITSPEALVNEQAPFSEDVWNKITAALTGGVKAVGPTALIALAALALSASVLI
ncbi:SAG family member [Eimeria maxima]|uniref:SAG family member n=1 Tax=Eimeria maxima TaxID=5804 RepID=U6MGP1_EIMMA|nr:SAG family member [Eimeria maxima]CDJ60815.1 SAG family member [Eimeria maxima]